MKRIDYILIGLLAISSLTACTEKKKSNIIIAPKPVAKVVNKATQKMSDYEQTREADWVGSHYKVVVKRSSDKELPVLQLDENTKYYDNRISVKVLRSDGSEFFSRTFTKKDFTSYIDKHTQDMGALLGIVYVKAEGDYLYFAASVGSPDVTSDEYVPLVLKISRMGSISISRMRSWIPTLLLKRKKMKKMGYKAVLPLIHNEKFMAIRTFWIKFHA